MDFGIECLRVMTPDALIDPRIIRVMGLLLQAHSYAGDLQQSTWAFATEISIVLAEVTANDLRWLVHKGYLEHATEVTKPCHSERTFRADANFKFNKETCFVLTEQGVGIARRLREQMELRVERKAPEPSRHLNGNVGAGLPSWDRDLQELRLNGSIVKQFKLPAPNQETVLAAFQEDGWPPRVDDPLPPHVNQDPKRRLHDTINCLNRNQKHRLIRFFGDGSGQGIRWELVSFADNHPATEPSAALADVESSRCDKTRSSDRRLV
jgi:hypothetical protein